MRMLRVGTDMIDSTFVQMHHLIDRAKAALHEELKRQLVAAFQARVEKQTEQARSQIEKLEAYLAKLTPDLQLL